MNSNQNTNKERIISNDEFQIIDNIEDYRSNQFIIESNIKGPIPSEENVNQSFKKISIDMDKNDKKLLLNCDKIEKSDNLRNNDMNSEFNILNSKINMNDCISKYCIRKNKSNDQIFYTIKKENFLDSIENGTNNQNIHISNKDSLIEVVNDTKFLQNKFNREKTIISNVNFGYEPNSNEKQLLFSLNTDTNKEFLEMKLKYFKFVNEIKMKKENIEFKSSLDLLENSIKYEVSRLNNDNYSSITLVDIHKLKMILKYFLYSFRKLIKDDILKEVLSLLNKEN